MPCRHKEIIVTKNILFALFLTNLKKEEISQFDPFFRVPKYEVIFNSQASLFFIVYQLGQKSKMNRIQNILNAGNATR